MTPIYTIRHRLGLTQKQLADALGCTQGNVGHYERGQTVPPKAATQLIAICRERGVQITLDQVYGLAELPEQAAQPSEHAEVSASETQPRTGHASAESDASQPVLLLEHHHVSGE